MSELSKNRPPNLFHYATKELSQDAMICWLLEWSNHRHRPGHEGLHDCGVRFVRALLEKHGASLRGNIKEVEIHQQESGIDVLARINGKHVLLIEDKTGTKDHSKQLERYYERVIKTDTPLGEVAKGHLYPIYFKTGNQALADDHRIEKTGCYKVFNRGDFLKVLKGYGGRNSILVDFRRHLQGLDDKTNSYAKWTGDGERESWQAWEGFYRRLECELDSSTRRSSGWGYVPNRSGGFLGFWWWLSNEDEIYLQIEGGGKGAKLCFKVEAGEDSDQQERLKWHWHKLILKAGGQQVVKPDVMRRGQTMTVAWWNDWLAFGKSGKLNVSGTVENLKRAEAVLKQALMG